MGKGLSSLQKEILTLSLQSHMEDRPATGKDTDTSARDIFVHVYGFPPLRDLDYTRPGAFVFSRELIGRNRYDAASVAVAKAFKRLVKRGLAIRQYNHGILLTSSGIEEAKPLYRQGPGMRKESRET